MKKLFSVLIALMIAASLIAPVATVESSAAFDTRTTVPSFSSHAGRTYYYSNNNIFYRSGYGPNRQKRYDGRYCVGNCTWYAYGRASEILGRNLNSNFRWSASAWWDINKRGNYYPYGSKPKVGAIACYGTHVAIVEKVINGRPYVSESGWTLSRNRPRSERDIVFHYGSPWCRSPKGYIYITNDRANTAKVKNVSYSVKITAKDLNMRTGPGTEYSSNGYVRQGTYKASQECGSWIKLADSGLWVSSRYVRKVDTAVDTVVNTGKDTNYKVRISAVNLYMRLGPGTAYRNRGYISPGTYTVVKTDNGWGKIRETGYWVSLKYTSRVNGNDIDSSKPAYGNPYKVKVNTLALRLRTGPGTEYSSNGVILIGTKCTVKNTRNGWGQLAENGYWIKLSYTIPVNGEFNVKITAKDLNRRTGPGIFYKRKGYMKPGIYTIVKTDGGWGKVKNTGDWIKLSYTRKI